MAVEEPLEVRIGLLLNGRPVQRRIAVTMRTPGHDAELAIGFLFTEGVLADRTQVAGIRQRGNVVRITVTPGTAVDLSVVRRRFVTSSSCGVCGKASLAAVQVVTRFRPVPDSPIVDSEVIHRLPEALRAAQAVFEQTGGIHASALFDPAGQLVGIREDVGRHNALDKLIGAELLAGRVPLSGSILAVSGRVSFELVQKAATAGLPVIAAVGAPSSLAVDVARQFGITLLGFVRADRFNIYTGAGRIRMRPSAAPRTDD